MSTQILNQEIYNNALALIAQDINGKDIDDLEDRAPYLIASFCCSAKNIDKSIRKDEGLDEQKNFSSVYLSLNEDFPLCSTLSSPAALYVAAMLMIDEDPDLSDSIYDKYCNAMAPLTAIHQAVCDANKFAKTSCESIAERYFFD